MPMWDINNVLLVGMNEFGIYILYRKLVCATFCSCGRRRRRYFTPFECSGQPGCQQWILTNLKLDNESNIYHVAFGAFATKGK